MRMYNGGYKTWSEQCECTMMGMENLSQKTIGNKYIDMCTAYSHIIITGALN